MDSFESDERQVDGRESLVLAKDVKDIMDREEK